MYLSDHMITEVTNAVGDIWILLFSASYIFSLVFGIIYRGKVEETCNKRPFRALAILHYAWVAPIVLPICAVYWIGVRLLSIPLYVLLAAALLWSRGRSLVAKSN